MKRLLALVFFLWSSVAFAQTPTPVVPGYQTCNSSSGSTVCGFTPTTTSTPLPVTGTTSVSGAVALDQTTPGTTNGVVSKGGANIAASQTAPGTTATIAVAARAGRLSVTLTNLGTVDTFCGPTGVTTTTGTLLVGTKGASITIPTAAAVYCVVGTGTGSVSALEAY